MKKLLILLALLLVPALAIAQEAVTGATGAATLPVDENPFSLFSALVQAFQAKDWGVFAAGLITLLTYLLKRTKLKDFIPLNVWPWLAGGLAVLGAVSTNLVAHMVWWQAILHGLLVGPAAVGLWEMVGKHVLPSTPAPAAGSPVQVAEAKKAADKGTLA